MCSTRREPAFTDHGVGTAVRDRAKIWAHVDDSIMASRAVTDDRFVALIRKIVCGWCGIAFQSALLQINGLEVRTSMPTIGGPRRGSRW
jgi:hypothetical protein